MEKYIYNFFYKTKGVVSVFLVIILVPMVTACSLFVDASRIKLARAVIESSGDLALNTVMSQFDSDLADIYGLMASCQNNQDAINTAKEYFKNCMVSQGVDDIAADEMSELMKKILDGDGSDAVVNDLLGITVDDSETKIEEIDNGNLANAAILESQIVEFMKYRAPIGAVEDLFNNLKDKFGNSTKYSEEETDLVNDMQKYYEAEGNVIQCLQLVYEKIGELNSLNLTADRIKGVKDKLDDLTKKYTNTSKDGNMYKGYHYSLVNHLFTYTSYTPSEIRYQGKEINVGEYTGTITATPNVKNYSESLRNAYTNYKQHNEYASQLKSKNSSYAYVNNKTQNAQYWMLLQKNGIETILNNYLKYTHIGDEHSVYRSYDILKAQEKWLENNRDEEITIDGEETTLGAATDKILKEIKDLGREEEEATKIYKTLRERLANISQTYFSQISQIKTQYGNELQAASAELADICSDISRANTIINGEGGIIALLDNTLSAVEEWKSRHENWGNDFSNKDFAQNSDLAKDNKKTYDKLGNNDEDENELDPAKCEELKAQILDLEGRLNRISSLLDTVKSAINGTTYGDSTHKKSVKDIGSVDALKAASGLTINDMSIDQTTMNNLANTSLFTKSDNISGIKVVASGDGINCLPIAKNDSELYKEMEKRFGKQAQNNKNKEDNKTAENNYEDIKEQKEEKAASFKSEDYADSSGKPIKNESNECGSLPSNGEGGGDSGSFTSDISAIAGHVKGLFTDIGKEAGNIRDLLYIWYYINNMFSYDTFEKEMEYNSKHSDQNSLSEQEKNFEKTSLTNISIDAEHNYSYRCEIEYILYGKDSIADNKFASYGTIYTIRFVLNMIYAFSHFWTDSAVCSLAAGVSAATLGVVPEPLVKLIVILGLTTIESAWDINQLRQGYPVALIKKDDSWKCQLSANSITSDESPYDGDENGFQYSDYIKLFLIMKLLTRENVVLLRTADLIQANMRMKSNGFLMNKANVYYKLNFKCKTSILMLALPIVQNSNEGANELKLESWNTISGVMYRGY